MDFEFFMPAHLIFGLGKIKDTGLYAKSFGKNALIVTGKSSAKKTGHLDTVAKSLEKEGVNWTLFDEVEPNPLTTTIDKGITLARDNKADVIIGLGGGSAMDSAKAIAFGVKREGSIANYFGPQPAGDVLPIILIPTTAGTGSEANNYSVMTNPKTSAKKSFSSPDTFAKVSIIDPELMLTVPKKVTASTGIDVFFHALESYLSKRSQPISKPLAFEAMRLVLDNLKGAYEHGDKIEYRESMAWASTIAGMAINLSGTCGIHGLGHPISAYYNIAHGETLAAVSIAFLRFSLPDASPKLAEVAELFGIDTKDISENEAAQKAIKALEEFVKSLGIPTKISALGVKEEDIDKLAQNAYENASSNLKSSPKFPSLEDVKKIYRDSL